MKEYSVLALLDRLCLIHFWHQMSCSYILRAENVRNNFKGIKEKGLLLKDTGTRESVLIVSSKALFAHLKRARA